MAINEAATLVRHNEGMDSLRYQLVEQQNMTQDLSRVQSNIHNAAISDLTATISALTDTISYLESALHQAEVDISKGKEYRVSSEQAMAEAQDAIDKLTLQLRTAQEDLEDVKTYSLSKVSVLRSFNSCYY